MTRAHQPTIVEGVGDEVVYAAGAFLGILVPVIIYIIRNLNR